MHRSRTCSPSRRSESLRALYETGLVYECPEPLCDGGVFVGLNLTTVQVTTAATEIVPTMNTATPMRLRTVDTTNLE